MALVVLIHAMVFLVYWLTNLPFQESLNNFLIGATGLRANFLIGFMVFAGLMGVWSGVRLALRRDASRAGLAWLFLSIAIFFLVFFYGSFGFLFIKNPVQLARLGHLYLYFRLVFDASLLGILAWGVPRWVKLNGAWKKVILPAGLLGLWLLPVFWTPENVYRGVQPDKPQLIGHRGASTLAPENTLASMQKAAEFGVYGVETDISVSADGILFLMHDAGLGRTTDVAQVFPGQNGAPAETFTWQELSRLDAGSWFGQLEAFSGEPIPTLAALLQVVKAHDLHFIYDLRIPSAGHAYTGQALDLCLSEIQAAGVTDHTWVLAEPAAIARVRSVLPGAILAKGLGYTDTLPTPAALVTDGYQVVNGAYGLPVHNIRAYQQAGLWVNLWVVDEPWEFSRLWLAGVDSTTTNNLQELLALSQPVLAMSYGLFLLIWGLAGLVAAAGYWWTMRRQSARVEKGKPQESFKSK